MANQRKNVKTVTRREFLAGAEAVLAMGATATLSAAVLAQTQIPVPDVIGHNADACAGCGVCGLMCALYHEGEMGPSMARAEIVRDFFAPAFTLHVCRQCKSPNCYAACPRKDSALCIDRLTGVSYVNAKYCDGCGKCSKACPFTPVHARVQPRKKVSFKCDLCRGRDQGSICVEYCSMRALTRIPGSERE